LGWPAGRPLRINSDRDDRVLVLDEIAQVAVFLVADRGLEADRLLGDLHHLADLLERHAEALGHFLGPKAQIGLAVLLVEERRRNEHHAGGMMPAGAGCKAAVGGWCARAC
jgi:hypothetical protein